MNELGAQGKVVESMALFLQSLMNKHDVDRKVGTIDDKKEGLKGKVEKGQKDTENEVKKNNPFVKNPPSANESKSPKNPKNPKKPIVNEPTPPPAKPSKNTTPKQGDNNTPPVDKKKQKGYKR